MDKPDDKPKQTDAYEDPKLFVVVGGKAFPRMGLETAFVDFPDEWKTDSGKTDPDSAIVGGVVCSCNKVRVRSRPIEWPEPKMRKSGSSSGSRGGSGCRCAPVH
jgi:hypothetical protein